MAPMDREVAAAKLRALVEGTALARKKLGKRKAVTKRKRAGR
jgi:hypothetical protein